MIRVVVLPFGVASSQYNILSGEPLPDDVHVPGPVMIVDYIGHRHIDLISGPDRISRLEEPNPVTVFDTTLDQSIPIAGEWLGLGIGDLAGQSKAAGGITVRTGVPLHENPMKNRILGIVDPMLLGQVLPSHTDVDATYRDVPEARCRLPDIGGRLLTDDLDERREGHGA